MLLDEDDVTILISMALEIILLIAAVLLYAVYSRKVLGIILMVLMGLLFIFGVFLPIFEINIIYNFFTSSDEEDSDDDKSISASSKSKESYVLHEPEKAVSKIKAKTKDRKHSQLINFILKSTEFLHYENKEVEYHFSHFKYKGYIDVIFWSKLYDKTDIVIVEAKSKIDNTGEIIRQIHQYRDYLLEKVDKIFGNLPNKNITTFLVTYSTQDNVDAIIENKAIFKSAKIDRYMFVNVKTGTSIVTSIDKIDSYILETQAGIKTLDNF